MITLIFSTIFSFYINNTIQKSGHSVKRNKLFPIAKNLVTSSFADPGVYP
jgi:hypothetical protein